ncbi:MAG: hypothetical protein IT434_09590 [Phycisphaerales bacterium]|nr:hypothetical protein [Phycisphaerales bacterium]
MSDRVIEIVIPTGSGTIVARVRVDGAPLTPRHVRTVIKFLDEIADDWNEGSE